MKDYAVKDLYDVWFPNLAPRELLLRTLTPPPDAASWRIFSRRLAAEMKQPGARRDLDLLAALWHHANVAIGCYCEDEARCHRSILRKLLDGRGADIRSQPSGNRENSLFLARKRPGSGPLSARVRPDFPGYIIDCR
jgi:uncharacterized protein YeaO (DUF488 family)